MSLYKVAIKLCEIFLNLIFRIERTGIENIPLSGSCLFCANHRSNFDAMVIATVKAREFYFLSKEEIVKIPVVGPILKKLNVIPIKRGAGDLGAIRKSIETLKENKALLMFPEGTRSKDGNLKEGKDGVALIAKKAQCKVVPCAIVGKYKLFGKIKLVFGNPIDMSEFINEKDNKVITKVIMNEIKKLIDTNS